MTTSTLLAGIVLATSAAVVRVPIDEPVPAVAPASPSPGPIRSAAPARATGTAVDNVRVNDPSQFAGPIADIIPAIAVNGSKVLVVWRVVGALPTQRLRAAISEDGGAHFSDVGWLPNPPGNWRWGVDPCVDVDPSDGTFLVASQAVDPALPATGVATITAHVANGITWGASAIAITSGYIGAFYAPSLETTFDATDHSWHLAFHDDYNTPHQLTHRLSTNHGLTWSAPSVIVSDANGYDGVAPAVGFVGNRGPIVLYGGSTYGTWWEAGWLRSSSWVWWAGFQPPVPLDLTRLETLSLPGTQGDRISCPSIAVDRTPFVYSNRIYSTWIDSAILNPWPEADWISLWEVEPNDTPAQATSVAPSGQLTGALSSSTDVDVFQIPLLEGRNLVLEPILIESLGSNANLQIEVLTEDGVHGLGFSAVLATDANAGARHLFTAPRTANYFVRLKGFRVGEYDVKIAWSDQLPGPTVDRRDVMVSYSQDLGASWQAPERVKTSLPGFDAALSKVVVANDGCPYVFWIDFSSDNRFGSEATLMVTRSGDGGATWAPPRQVSTTATDWQMVTALSGGTKIGYRLDAATTPVSLAGPAPPMSTGARSSMWGPAGSGDLHVTWTDGRDGEGNIYAAHFPTGSEVVSVTTDTTATPGQNVGLRLHVLNHNPLFAEIIEPMSVSSPYEWVVDFQTFDVLPGETNVWYPFVVEVPDTAVARTVSFQGVVRIGTRLYALNAAIHVQPPLGAPSSSAGALTLEAPAPNPARSLSDLRFRLPAAADVALEIFDVSGARVRTLVRERRDSGWNAARWDLRDGAGHAVAPGLYVARLTTEGTSRTRRLMVTR